MELEDWGPGEAVEGFQGHGLDLSLISISSS